jgi:hypothetical protein
MSAEERCLLYDSMHSLRYKTMKNTFWFLAHFSRKSWPHSSSQAQILKMQFLTAFTSLKTTGRELKKREKPKHEIIGPQNIEAEQRK